MFIKKKLKLKYFTRPKQISPDLSGDFHIVCYIEDDRSDMLDRQTERF